MVDTPVLLPLHTAQVKDAMNDINAARRQRVAAVENAETAKVNTVKAAEAQAEAMFLQVREYSTL